MIIKKINRILIFGFLNCGKSYPKNHSLHQKQEPIFEFTKSLNQNPLIKAQTSDEIQPLENYENSTVVFDDMWLLKQSSNIDLFLIGHVLILLIFTTHLQAFFTSLK